MYPNRIDGRHPDIFIQIKGEGHLVGPGMESYGGCLNIILVAQARRHGDADAEENSVEGITGKVVIVIEGCVSLNNNNKKV